jgi:hypothetical protein
MEIFPLNKLQVIKLSDFFFDIAKGSILGGLGFIVVAPPQFTLRLSLFTGGLLIATICLYIGLWLIKGVER